MPSPTTHPPRLLISFVTVAALLGAASGPAPHAAAAGGDPALSTKLRTLMQDTRVQQATSGAMVIDAASGAELYARYPARAITPASNTKIFTALAALETLGPTYRFRTDVIRRGSVVNGTLRGNLYLK